jgi:hypothetical protein
METTSQEGITVWLCCVGPTEWRRVPGITKNQNQKMLPYTQSLLLKQYHKLSESDMYQELALYMIKSVELNVAGLGKSRKPRDLWVHLTDHDTTYIEKIKEFILSYANGPINFRIVEKTAQTKKCALKIDWDRLLQAIEDRKKGSNCKKDVNDNGRVRQSVTVWICHVTDEDWRAITRKFASTDTRIINGPRMLRLVKRDKSIDNEAAYMLTAADIVKKASYNLRQYYDRAPRDIWYRVGSSDPDVIANIRELLQPIADVPLKFKILTKAS